jgi:hypothetical protein
VLRLQLMQLCLGLTAAISQALRTDVTCPPASRLESVNQLVSEVSSAVVVPGSIGVGALSHPSKLA